ncbi:MAG: ankyrin repeat domain-containing protein [Halanaerobiales bacterium]|nr:ankyrin repeat domain-containing protein [Halanaerobiales bacterium]
MKIAELLIENGANINEESRDALNALMYASATNSVEVAELLLENDAETYSYHYGENMAQKLAEQNDHEEILKKS